MSIRFVGCCCWLSLVVLVGCQSSRRRPLQSSPPTAPSTASAPRTPPSQARGTAPPLRPLVIPEATPGPVSMTDRDDPAQLIPPPPSLASLEGRPTPPLVPPTASDARDAAIIPASLSRTSAEAGDANQPPPLESIRAVHRNAVENYARVESFEARLTRQEVVGGKQQPREVLLFQFRKKPLSVHMKWIGSEGQGREVLYVQGKYDNKLQILPARGDTAPLPPFKMALAPDDPTILAKSRHDIREAGFAEAITHLGKTLSRIDARQADANRLRYLGAVTRPEYAAPMVGVEEAIPAGEDRGFPKGGKREYYFDATQGSPASGLPVLVIARDEKGREVEYYCFDRFLHPARLDEADFDPARMGKR